MLPAPTMKRGIDAAMAAFQEAKKKRLSAQSEVSDDGDDSETEETPEFPLSVSDAELEKVDLYRLLHLNPKIDSETSLSEARQNIKTDRVRHAFHRLSQKYHPRYGTAMRLSLEQTTRRFQEVCFAFNVLRDKVRKDIYDRLGLLALRQHESFMERSVFEEDSYFVYDCFFDGTDNDDKMYLLLNGPNCLTSSDEEEEVEDDESATEREEGTKDRQVVEEQATQITSTSLQRVEIVGAKTSSSKGMGKSNDDAGEDADDDEDDDNEDSEIPLAAHELDDLRPKAAAEAEIKAMEEAILDKMLGGSIAPALAGVVSTLPSTSSSSAASVKPAEADVWTKLKELASSSHKSPASHP
eukprot:INCI10471.3.p1 GENE.INCI10471.3~~INCI10471.3.p1  ORF type:complete len:354 (-),score=69.15 INCI10471.3:701-1762(-)